MVYNCACVPKPEIGFPEPFTRMFLCMLPQLFFQRMVILDRTVLETAPADVDGTAYPADAEGARSSAVLDDLSLMAGC